MEIIVPHAQLIKSLELITKISTKHVTLPVLQCVLIIVTEDKIVCKATNLELSIEVELPGRIQEVGTIAIPAATLLQSIQYISQSDVTLRTEDGVLLIESKQTNTSIKSISADEFPNIHHLEGEGIQLNRSLFALGIKTSAFAASQSSIKPELGSVFIQQKKEHSLTFVSTDSFRLMEKTVPQKGVILQHSFLVPQKNAIELARICDLLQTDPLLVVTENQCALSFTTEGVYITSRLVSGSFPDYEQIIPKEYVTKATLLKNDLQNAFKKTSVFLNKFMQVSLTVTDKTVTISSQNNEVGHITDTINAVVEGDELSLNFNQQYVIEPLSHITDESIILNFAGIGRPLVITGASDTSLRYLVMPMNR
ncbi:DNA polymerase III subunit beta [Candidatus Kaiserbacteria bacterium RIFCSPLOWO2_02_FULL_45_11b]|uniref:Beta sliding clamp n=1 Tax=Candidatus Kaiserbacteria bacterium RIFCSPLOWO2_12_FULL_45_26 TaxID=1798525 RepID=A0A1F6FFE9_9BACT|nr:MAG: DNA polymerase III subunit beta [Candidatus Kaiserbacteria bacterium RIFCSPHIGHO2_12_45_16]OGG70318.1 MAG: DNA polymerase III subunit beta [Candidatus Kaiserbacteria bacterium RIFCSPLOWO2_01_FULL_45_25]OGG81985.1 MAG: DNA polymerase III subunit beta [Candidatus Kaiserbacteria bacterium RIFCSPLOWO2_02_FULL_45_11b]OGG84582.1 MAG: DNA polymerase III subunit beta [Candidatus Kaiserbacteria bacterium RIFCSPLOWO2_12_FULL_45_26]